MNIITVLYREEKLVAEEGPIPGWVYLRVGDDFIVQVTRSHAETLRANLNRIFAPALVSEPSTPSTKAA